MQERLAKLSELIKSEFSKEVITEAKKIAEEIDAIFRNQHQEALKSFLEDPENKSEDFSPVQSEEEQQFRALSSEFKEKRKAFAEQRAKQEKENLEKKEAIIKKIEQITRDEENIGKAFASLNELQDSFKEIGRVPGDRHRDIQNAYSAALDSFYYHINIYRDLKEFDLKKNLDQKVDIVNKLEVLAKADADKLESNVKQLQQSWYDIGPVPKDDFEALKVKFDAALDQVYDIIKANRNARKEQLLENLEKKKALLAKAQELVGTKPNSSKAWNKATDQLIEIQKEWKSIGFGPRKENEAIWVEFRGLCDQFFADKGAYFEVFKKELNLNQIQKEELCDKAEVLKDSTDWRETTKKLVDLQKKWKTVGPAPQSQEQKLWKRFRAACDHFFNEKEASHKKLEAGFEENLKVKEAFVQEFKSLELAADKSEATKQLKKVLQQWAGLGKVPKNQIEGINSAFQDEFDKKLTAAGIEKEELEHSKFTSKINGLLADGDFKRLMENERKFIQDKIEEFKKQSIQYENNLAFFGNAKNSKNPLLAEAQKKVEHTNKAIEKMQDQVKFINKSLRQKIKEVEAAKAPAEENVEENN